MADSYHRYTSEELPLANNANSNQPTNRELTVSTFAATRPTTEAAAKESLLGLDGLNMSSSAFFDDVVGFSMGSLGDIGDPAGGKLRVYDDEYGVGQPPRASMEHVSQLTIEDRSSNTNNLSRSEEFVEEKIGSSSRGELSGPAIITPVGPDGQQDAFADTDLGIEGGGDEDVVSSDENDDDSQVGPDNGGGLNNLMTLQSRRRNDNWRASSSDAEYQSEMEFFVEDGDDGEGDMGDGMVERSMRAGARLQMMEDMAKEKKDNGINQSSSSLLSSSSNNAADDPLMMPVDMSTVKDMKKEDYWDLFNKILTTPTAHVAEEEKMDPAEFLRQQKEALEEQRAAQVKQAKEQAKWQRLAQRERKRRSLNQARANSGAPARSRSTEVFEPPPNLTKARNQDVPKPPAISSRAKSVDGEVFGTPPPSQPRVRKQQAAVPQAPSRCRSVDTEVFEPPKIYKPSQQEKAAALQRSSSFGGVTVNERQRQQPTLSPRVLLRKKLHSFRLKKPDFVNNLEHKTQKVMASFSSKFHPKRIEQHHRTYDG